MTVILIIINLHDGIVQIPMNSMPACHQAAVYINNSDSQSEAYCVDVTRGEH